MVLFTLLWQRIVEKSSYEDLKLIKKYFLQLKQTYLARICWESFAICIIYGCEIQVVSEKTLRSKGFLAIWKTISYINNCIYNSNKISQKSAFISFLTFCRSQKEEANFQNVGGLVTKNHAGFSYYSFMVIVSGLFCPFLPFFSSLLFKLIFKLLLLLFTLWI